MKHLTEQELILYYYGEDQSAAPHLEGCEACRAAYQDLQRLLNTVGQAPVPERAENYEDEVWRSVQPRLRTRSNMRSSAWQLAWLIPVAAALLVGAFLLGRWQRTPVPAANTAQIRERVLLVALGDHLERSQMVLVELAHAAPENRPAEQDAAEDLLEANRLYRQTAQSTGDAGAAAVLDDLERVLLEIAHSPSSVSQGQLDDMLFKVKVFGSRIRERESANGKS
jgi:hypothetical protein